MVPTTAGTVTSIVTRRRVIVAGLAAAATPWLPGMTKAWALSDPDGREVRAFGFPEPDTSSQVVRPMSFPVQGRVNWTDTYGACRDGCTRRHEGQDLLGAKLQPLIACVDGTIVGFKHAADGNYLYIQDAEGWNYGYLHINNDTPGTDDGANRFEFAFVPGMAAGVRVQRGQVIAFMGDSGNAESTVPHLHYEIRKPADAWYHGQAVNPKYSLNAAGDAPPRADPQLFTPWTNASAFVAQQYRDFLGREADAVGLRSWSDELDQGLRTPPSLVHYFLRSAEFEARMAPLTRLYFGYFNRIPDAGGLLYWFDLLRAGRASIGAIAQQFARSSEFVGTYGTLDDGAFVDRVYGNVLGRAPDPSGRQYWVDRLAAGTSRGTVMVNFTESSENRARRSTAVLVTLAYVGMLRRSPDASGFGYWVDRVDGATPAVELIRQLQFSAEYRQRFA